jgi:hypothetical protein
MAFRERHSKDTFELDDKPNLALAEKYWAEEAKGCNGFRRRASRPIFRMPHYRSDEGLARAVPEKKAATKEVR